MVHPHDVKALFDDYPDVPLVSISNDQRSPMHQADRVSVPPQMLVVLFDRFANVTQAIRRDDECQIALFHRVPLLTNVRDGAREWPEDFPKNP
jgi:hypothetical protein